MGLSSFQRQPWKKFQTLPELKKCLMWKERGSPTRVDPRSVALPSHHVPSPWNKSYLCSTLEHGTQGHCWELHRPGITVKDMKGTCDDFHDLSEHQSQVCAHSHNHTTSMWREGPVGWFTKAIVILVYCFSKLAHSRYSLSALSEKFRWVPYFSEHFEIIKVSVTKLSPKYGLDSIRKSDGPEHWTAPHFYWKMTLLSNLQVGLISN